MSGLNIRKQIKQKGVLFMFVRDYDNRNNVEISLDDFIEIANQLGEAEVIENLDEAIVELKKKLYWYEIIQEALIEKKNKEILEERA